MQMTVKQWKRLAEKKLKETVNRETHEKNADKRPNYKKSQMMQG